MKLSNPSCLETLFKAFMNCKSVYFFLLVTLVICTSCQEDNGVKYLGESVEFTPKKEISIDSIKIDTLINNDIFFSGLGTWVIFNDSLTLLDRKLVSAHVFSDDLVHRSTNLGRGDGPNSINNIILETTIMDDYLVILGGSYQYFFINKNWEIVKRGQFDFYHENTSYEELLNNPKAHNVGHYDVFIEHLKLGHDYRGNLVFSITIPHPDFNYLWHEKFYQEARVLGKVNPDDPKVSIHGGYSPIYHRYRFLSTLTGAPFSYLDADTYIQGYEADSILYKLSGFGEVQYAFGVAGKEMNIAYENFKAEDVEEYEAVWKLDRDRYGYYHSVDYVRETGLLFRGYTKSNPLVDGMQIYRDDTLIGDVEVPKGFQFVGYKAPYYYGEFKYRPDKEEDSIKLLRFELPDN
ncbi:MAG: hypothetical protein JJU34_17875 [Lunatimonas sp.]|uniref:hypothetical protein n=1 Tax=Lunatimonas sp. TaxID=2060141 RepID=UPI00263AC93D|nr:hypothetical protein [Lunatimonas sp.]MCC5939153.1 hypothetical protein [Lunatimonas sp.]